MLTYAYMRSMPEEVHSTLIEISDDTFVAEEPFGKDSSHLITDLWDDEESDVESDSEDNKHSIKLFAPPFCACHTLPWSVNYENYVRRSPSDEDSTDQSEADSNQEDSQPEEENATTSQPQETNHQSSSETPAVPLLKQKIEHWRSNAVPIGSGTFCDAFLFQITKDGEQKAIVAKVRKSITNQTEDKLFVSLIEELRQLKQLEHQGIVELISYEGSWPEKLVVLYLEYLPLSFKDLILSTQRFEQDNEFNYLLSAHGFADMLMRILDVLEYLRKENILYLDLHSKNLRFTEKGVLKFIDFGSLFKIEPQSKLTGAAECYHVAPEIRAGEPATTKGQMFGIGLLIVQVLQGKYIETKKNVEQLIGLARTSEQRPLLRKLVTSWSELDVEQYIKILQEIAYPCCCVKPENRPEFQAVKDCLEVVIEDIELNEPDSDDLYSDVDEYSDGNNLPVKRQKVQ